MRKFTGSVLCCMTLTMSLHAQQKGKVQEPLSADYYMEHYLFEDAEKLIKQDITKLKRKRKPTENEEQKLERINRLRSMMSATEQVTFIDSLVVDKSQFLNHIKLSPESGRIGTAKAYFNQNDDNECTAYLSELGNKLCFSQPDKDGFLRLYTSNLVGKNWDTPRLLDELDGDDAQNYPFMLSDGITLYYAAQGDESIGGYDIFVTRYDNDENKFLYPENIGMPFNSTANDYMFAIDEFNKIGWFVSDRNQPADKVCIYTFIPNDVRKIYSAEEISEKELGKLARISRIADTWTDKNAVNDARNRLNKAMNTIQESEKKKDFELVINDRTVYTRLTDFRSTEARKLAAEWKMAKEQLARQKEQLDSWRDEYAKAGDARRKQLGSQIMKAETLYEKAETALHEQEKQVRNTEIRTLKP